jgi:hypothetical protein
MLYDRPSPRELDKRIEEAKACLKERRGLFANPAKAVGELCELAINDSADVWRLIYELLDEIAPSNYAGTRPPQKSYEKAIANRELFAFTWKSPKMGKEMYIKFALREGLYYYVSLHVSRKVEKEGDTKNEMPAMRGRAVREKENALYP